MLLQLLGNYQDRTLFQLRLVPGAAVFLAGVSVLDVPRSGDGAKQVFSFHVVFLLSLVKYDYFRQAAVGEEVQGFQFLPPSAWAVNSRPGQLASLVLIRPPAHARAAGFSVTFPPLPKAGGRLVLPGHGPVLHGVSSLSWWCGTLGTLGGTLAGHIKTGSTPHGSWLGTLGTLLFYFLYIRE